MPDLAELGLRVTSQEVAVADDRLNDFAAAAGRAETSADRLAMAARRSDGAVGTMNVALRQQRSVMDASRHATGLNTNEMLNLTRQFSDLGVTAASGMNPLMILIQQGPQIADVFQAASARGVGFSAALRSIMLSLTPILAILGPIVLAVGAVGAIFALAARQASQENKGLLDSLDLTDKQLEKLKKSGEDTGITMGDAFKAFGTTVKEVLAEAFGPQIEQAKSAWDKWLDDLATNTGKEISAILGFFVGTYRAITAVWSGLPAAFGDAAVQAANLMIASLNFMVQKSVDAINGLRDRYNALPAWMRGGQEAPRMSAPQMAPMANANAGALSRTANQGAAGYRTGVAEADAMTAGFMNRWNRNMAATAKDRWKEAAGDAAAGGAGQSAAEREYDRLMKAGESYRQGLIKEREVLGLTALERRAYEAQAQADILIKKGQTDAARALAGEILKEAAALQEATLAYQHSEAMKKQSQTREMLELERDLIGATNVERARQIAMLQTEIELRNRLGKSAGVYIASARGQAEIRGAGDNAALGATNGQAVAAYNIGLEYQLDLLRQIDDQTRSAAQGMAEAFGEAGQAIGGVVTALSGYQARIGEIDEAERRYRETVGATGVDQRRMALFANERRSAEVGAYGDMISAAKGYFDESSDGYRILQTAEQAYRLIQFVGAVQAMFIGNQETGVSIANSAKRAFAFAAEAVANVYRSIPYPLNMIAAAGVIASLAALGIKVAGGGKGSSQSVASSVSTAQAQTAQDASSRSQAASAIASQVHVVVTADKKGMNAYIADTARNEAAPMVAAGEARSVRTATSIASRAAPARQQALRRLGA